MTKLSDHKSGEGKYLKASDVPAGKELRLTISKLSNEALDRDDGSKQQKAVLYFQGKEKGLVLNNTNIDTLIQGYGDDTGAIVGQPVILFQTTTSFKGTTVPCLRLRVPVQEVDEEEVRF